MRGSIFVCMFAWGSMCACVWLKRWHMRLCVCDDERRRPCLRMFPRRCACVYVGVHNHVRMCTICLCLHVTVCNHVCIYLCGVCVCTCMYNHVCICLCGVCVCVHVTVGNHVCICVHVTVCKHVYICLCGVCVLVCVRMCAYVFAVYVCVHVCVTMCAYVYAVFVCVYVRLQLEVEFQWPRPPKTDPPFDARPPIPPCNVLCVQWVSGCY